ncbi:hypothetical protein D3C84_1036860 [compost metagenome]
MFLQLHFLLGQVLFGLLKHLRGVENFHRLQLFSVPITRQVANLYAFDAALQMLGIGIYHLKTMRLEKLIAA